MQMFQGQTLPSCYNSLPIQSQKPLIIIKSGFMLDMLGHKDHIQWHCGDKFGLTILYYW